MNWAGDLNKDLVRWEWKRYAYIVGSTSTISKKKKKRYIVNIGLLQMQVEEEQYLCRNTYKANTTMKHRCVRKKLWAGFFFFQTKKDKNFWSTLLANARGCSALYKKDVPLWFSLSKEQIKIP